ncbi:tetratricopeptide repeat protein [Cysteiniphilum sp. SYW-8]|uniref:tetratricopeptide repeat protein n=1 Tax=Cysteiniphilum sp. SYW-8 TaxID=2610890 RepID=UPI00123CF0EA|nr:DUF6880 family protein [Cysteiniphilum sp. SYW-8]
MPLSLEDKLKSFDHETLINMIVEVSQASADNDKLIHSLLTIRNPKELYSILNKEITAIKNGRKFINYYEADAFTEKLYSIDSRINNYLIKQSPDLAFKLCKRLIEIDEKIFERVDDSGGSIGCFYDSLFETLDKAMANTKEAPEVIADYILEVYLNDDYGNRGSIIDHLKESLSDEVIKAIEAKLACVQNNDALRSETGSTKNIKAIISNDKVIRIHKKIADKQKNIDRYIALSETSGLNTHDICEIAKRLNNDFRSEEAIQWLNKITDDDQRSNDRDTLLIEAHMLEGDTDKAKAVIWSRFKRNLHIDDYLHYLKLASAEEKQHAKEEALKIARAEKYISRSFQFLHELNEYDAIETLFYERESEINGSDYYVYRKLSTSLHKHGKHLVAALLRRKLVESVLDSARSKSYRYAASDLKLAGDYAAEVKAWGDYPTHEAFIDKLRQDHSRKHSFWALTKKD